MLLETFNQPHNLPPAEFAKLADKSRQQIYKDIDAGRLLALKGEAAATELEEATAFLRRQGVQSSRVHVLAEGTDAGPVRVVEIVRPASTSSAARDRRTARQRRR